MSNMVLNIELNSFKQMKMNMAVVNNENIKEFAFKNVYSICSHMYIWNISCVWRKWKYYFRNLVYIYDL